MQNKNNKKNIKKKQPYSPPTIRLNPLKSNIQSGGQAVSENESGNLS